MCAKERHKTVPEELPVSSVEVNNKIDICKRRNLACYRLISKSGEGDKVKEEGGHICTQ